MSMNAERKAAPRVPIQIILLAVEGDIDAVNAILCHYDRYIKSLSRKKLRDDFGNVFHFQDETAVENISSALINKIGLFECA